MVYKEILNKLNDEISGIVRDFFSLAEANQANENDILLIYIHGFKVENEEFYKKNNLSPYVQGPEEVGYCLKDFHELFNFYNSNLHVSRDEYYEKLNDTNEREQAENNERLSINFELLIYLKFWEADLLLRRLYNLVRLCKGESYQWVFNPQLFENRGYLIRKEIQRPLEDLLPSLFNLIQEIYYRQIRNAIAHSKYYFLGRRIQFANKNENSYYKLFGLNFEDWETIYHKTILLCYHINSQFNQINQKFIDKANGKHFGIPIKIPEKDELGLKKTQWLKYDSYRNDWYWYGNRRF